MGSHSIEIIEQYNSQLYGTMIRKLAYYEDRIERTEKEIDKMKLHMSFMVLALGVVGIILSTSGCGKEKKLDPDGYRGDSGVDAGYDQDSSIDSGENDTGKDGGITVDAAPDSSTIEDSGVAENDAGDPDSGLPIDTDTTTDTTTTTTDDAGAGTDTNDTDTDTETDTDTGTGGLGLNWQTTVEEESLNWTDATNYCTLLGGRLPIIDELRELIVDCPDNEPGGSCGVTDPSCLNAVGCDDDCAWCNNGGCHLDSRITGPCGIPSATYWTSSVSSTGAIWIVNFATGGVTRMTPSNLGPALCILN